MRIIIHWLPLSCGINAVTALHKEQFSKFRYHLQTGACLHLWLIIIIQENLNLLAVAAVFTAQCTLVQMRGIGIACPYVVRLSVCLSVTLVICDHICWKSWKLIARTISPTPSLFVARR